MKLLTSEEHVQYDHVSRGGDNVQQHVDDTKYVMHTVGYFLGHDIYFFCQVRRIHSSCYLKVLFFLSEKSRLLLAFSFYH